METLRSLLNTAVWLSGELHPGILWDALCILLVFMELRL